MIQKQLVPISLGKGIDTKTDPKQVQGKLLDLRNGIFQTGLEIRKRPGYIALPSLGAGVFLSPYNNELVTSDGSSLYSYSASTASQVSKGSLPIVSLATQTVVRNTKQQTAQDSSINGTLQCFAWHDSSGGVRYSIIDQSTGQSLVNNVLVATNGVYPKVLSIGTKIVIIYYDSTATHLKYRAIDTSTPTSIGSATDIATDINTTTSVFDATVINGKIFIAYNSASARISLYSLSSALALSSRVDFGSDNCDLLTVFGDASFNVWVAYGINGSAGVDGKIDVFALNNAMNSTVLAKTNIDSFQISGTGPAFNTITGIVTGTTATVYYEVIVAALTNGIPLDYIKSNTVTTSAVVGSAATFNKGVGLASKAFSYSSHYFVLVAYQSNLQSTYFLVRDDGIIVAKLSQDEGGGLQSYRILPEMNLISSGVYQTASLIKDSLTVQNGIISAQTGVASAQFTFQSTAPSKFVLGNNLHVAGAIMKMYDGGSVVEHGFNVFPEDLYTTFDPSNPTYGGGVGKGASAASTNVKQYCAVYEWTDNQGQIHQSAPSIPISVTIPDPPAITIITGDLNGAVSPPHGGNQILNATGGSIGQYINLVAPTGEIAFCWNATITNKVGSTLTLSTSYFLVASSGDSFMITDVPLSLYFTNIFTPSGHAGFGSVNASFGQIIHPVTGKISNYPANTFFRSGTFSTSAGFDTNNPPNGLGNTNMYYGTDLLEIAVAAPTLRLTEKANVSLAIYATTCNGTIFYRASDPISLIYNDKTVDYVTFTDTNSDAVLVGNQQLYTTGGEFENIEVPASDFAFTFKSRAIVIPSDNETSWWFSKQVVPGQPVEFSDQFVKNVDSKVVKLTAGGALDDKIVLFGPTNIFYVAGNGPASTGANDDFTDAQLVSSDVGCTNPASVLLTPNGLMFQSKKGIYLLDRSLQVQYIGADVEAYNSFNVTSAQLMEKVNQARFTLSNGTELVFDYFYNQWDIFAGLSANDSCIFQDLHTFIGVSGAVWQESPTLFTDNGAAVLLSMTSNWMSFANIQGFQRVYSFLLLGQYKSPHVLTVSVYIDFDDSAPVQTVTIPVLSDPGEYEFRVFLTNQKCTAMKIKIEESQPGSLGEGLSISSLGFMVGVKRGYNKLPASKGYG